MTKQRLMEIIEDVRRASSAVNENAGEEVYPCREPLSTESLADYLTVVGNTLDIMEIDGRKDVNGATFRHLKMCRYCREIADCAHGTYLEIGGLR